MNFLKKGVCLYEEKNGKGSCRFEHLTQTEYAKRVNAEVSKKGGNGKP